MPTVSIRKSLSRMPGGTYAPRERTWAEVSFWIKENYLTNPNEGRRIDKAQERQRLFQGDGASDMEKMILKVFKDPEVIEKRKAFVEFALFNNVLKRDIGQLATIYTVPAVRTIGALPAPVDPAIADDQARHDAEMAAYEEQNLRYAEVQRLCRQHEVMQQLNELLELHSAVAIVPRMRDLPDQTKVPAIDLVTPGKFYAVRDPIDPTLLLAIIFENDYCLGDSDLEGAKWTMWTWHELVYINRAGDILEQYLTAENEYGAHGWGGIPVVFATVSPPAGKLLDENPCADLVAAQKSVTFLEILGLKEAKSATKQTHIQGDLAGAARRQSDDTENPILTGDGVQASVLDRSMPWLDFGKGSSRIDDTAASNRGISSAVAHSDTASSADAHDLARIPIRELRLKRHVPMREVEYQIAYLLSRLVARDRKDLEFSMDGWGVDFSDPQTPLGTAEALQVDEKELTLGLSSELRILMRRNPDLTYQQAKAVMLQLIADRTVRMEGMRQYQAAAGGMAQGSAPTLPDSAAGAAAAAIAPAALSWVKEVLRAAA